MKLSGKQLELQDTWINSKLSTTQTITLQSTVEVVDDDTVVKGENGTACHLNRPHESSIVLHIVEATCNELEKAERKEEEDMQQEDIAVSDGINFAILGSIPVQDAYRTVSHLDEAMFDFGIGPMIQLIPHKGVFEVLENPSDDMRQALYRMVLYILGPIYLVTQTFLIPRTPRSEATQVFRSAFTLTQSIMSCCFIVASSSCSMIERHS